MKRSYTIAIRRWWPFVLLCAAASCEWLATDRWPQAGATLASEAAGCVLAFVVSFAFAWRGCWGQRFPVMAFFAGMMLLGGPATDMFLNASMLNPGSLLVALALTPVVVVVAESALLGNAEGAASLWPGITAASGLLIVLPLPSLANAQNAAVLILAPLLTGLGCVLFRRSVQNSALTGSGWHVPSALAGAAVVFAFGAAARAEAERTFTAPALPATAINFVLAMLAALALRRLSATRYAACFVLVPLALLLEGFVSFHAAPNWRAIASAVLLAISAWALLRENGIASDQALPSIAS